MCAKNLLFLLSLPFESRTMLPHNAYNAAGGSNASCDMVPFNPLNVLISEKDLIKILGPDVKLNNINIYRNAFVHRSYCTRKNDNFVKGNLNCPAGCLPLQEESSERLEFLGDAVLGLVVGKYLFERYPDENEGFLTKMRTKLVNGVMLAHLGGILGIERFILISKQVEDNQGRKNKNTVEDCFEAFLGAMLLDADGQSMQPVYDWLVNFLEENVDFSELITVNTNYKDMMLKHYQHTYGIVPRFFALDTQTKNNLKVYLVCLKRPDGSIIAQGKGGSKKQAENVCARAALAAAGVDTTKDVDAGL